MVEAFISSLGSPTFLWIIWGFHIGVFVLTTLILTYHWNSYAVGDRNIRKAKRWYYSVSLSVLLISGVFILFV